MSWKYPKKNMKNNTPTEIEGINRGFQAVVDEIGQLNEHNWIANTFAAGVPPRASRATFEKDAAYIIHCSAVSRDPNTDLLEELGPVLDPDNLGFEIPLSRDWVRVPMGDAGALSITTKGGLFWILASFQHSTGTVEDYLDPLLNSPGTFYAIRVNGAVLPETILGSGENLSQDKADVTTSGLAGPYTYGPTPGMYGERLPCVTEAIVTIPPGVHRVDLVAKSVLANWDPPLTAALDPLPQQWCTNRELIVIEILR